MNVRIFKRKFVVYHIFLFISFILILIWFKPGYMLARAEEGLPLYNPLRTLYLYKSLWLDQGLGIASPFMIPRLSLYGFASVLHIMGISAWLTQAIIFFILILSGLLGTYSLINYLFPKSPSLLGLSSSFFYLFNLFTMTQVLSRFLYPLFFLWAYLPLFLLLWIQFIDSGKKKYLLFLILTSILYSDAFGLTASAATLWAPSFLYSIIKILKERKPKIVLLSILGFIVWGIINLWWVYPLLVLKDNTYSSFIQGTKSLDSLIEVSEYYPNKEIFLLKQNYYFGEKYFWKYFYEQPLLLILPKVAFTVVVFGIIAARRSRKWSYFLALLLVGWFISKGANPPLGSQFYSLSYRLFPFLQTLRNPYEKFGVVFLLAYSTFFGFGLVGISDFLKKLKFLFLPLSFFVFFILLVLPTWSGEVFSGYRVKVPDYYSEANSYLGGKDRGRILQLPFFRGSGMDFTWGYKGEEPSEFLFDRPSVSRSFIFVEFDDFYQSLGIPKYFRQSKNFTNILYLMDVEDIVIHRDVIRSPFHQEWIDDTREYIKNWKDIKFDRSFGELEVFNLPKDKRLGRVQLAGNIVKVNSLEDSFNFMTNDSFRVGYDAVLVNQQNPDFDLKLESSKLPKVSFRRISPSKYKVQITESKEPFVLILADNYNPIWEARIGPEKVEKHFEVNGFANAWFVEKLGNYEIDLVFRIWPWE